MAVELVGANKRQKVKGVPGTGKFRATGGDEDVTVDADDAKAEQFPRHTRQRRVDYEFSPLEICPVASASSNKLCTCSKVGRPPLMYDVLDLRTENADLSSTCF
jgi:hypothetical protein